MKSDELIRQFPAKRMKANDGLAVTADVWEEAHAYHRAQQQFHAMVHHGAGIAAGLQVIASDPPDSTVYVQPGIALDPAGRLISVSEPTAYDVGHTMEGMLYLVLTYDEGRPVADGSASGDGSPLYVHTQFGIAAAPALPDTPHVELARVRRASRDASITNAKNASRPALNEIDLRFRRSVGAPVESEINVGLAYLGGQPNARHLVGLGNVARTASSPGIQRIWVDDALDLRSGLERYALVCLVASGDFQLTPDEMNGIYHYLQGGGTVFFESCRHDQAQGTPKSDATFMDLLGSFGMKLGEIKSGHSLLSDPALFAVPPGGFETQGTPVVQIAEGLIFSGRDYGCLWEGERRGGPPAREDIRAAIEWGGNIIAYAVQRQSMTGARKA